jgi:hypothetical protein
VEGEERVRRWRENEKWEQLDLGVRVCEERKRTSYTRVPFIVGFNYG